MNVASFNMKYIALLSVVVVPWRVIANASANDAPEQLRAIQQKIGQFDFAAWANKKIDTLKTEAIGFGNSSDFKKISNTVTQELGEAAIKASNITSDFADDLADKGKRA